MSLFRRFTAAFLLVATLSSANALEKAARTPYLGAIVVDAQTGDVLFQDNADAHGYPASVTKLMTFLIVMERIDAGQLRLDESVKVSADAANTGGSQVYLKQGEVFSVDDLLYALIVQSANDAAVALAEHVAGSKEGFAALMNKKARELGLTGTTYRSPHGLTPGKGQQPDVSTARDIAKIARALVSRGTILRYSSVKERKFRQNTENPFVMRTHNHLLGAIRGCDGLKTGYFGAASGYSIAVTAERDGRRVIVVVLGSDERVARDIKAKELVEQGFASPKLTAFTGRSSQNPAQAPAATVASFSAAAADVPVATARAADATVPAAPAAAARQSSTAAQPEAMFQLPPHP